jgi:hypothetical protein
MKDLLNELVPVLFGLGLCFLIVIIVYYCVMNLNF